MPSSDRSVSSTKVQKGSIKETLSLPSKSPHKFSGTSEGVKPIDRYTTDEKDHRSHAVPEYDRCQKEGRAEHEQHLRDIVGKEY